MQLTEEILAKVSERE